MSSDMRPRSGTGPLASSDRLTGRLRHPTVTPENPVIERIASERTVVPPPIAALRKFSPSKFNAALVHFYRGEIQRANTWRNRLDTTTNWAVLTAGATLSFAFSSNANPHFVILINTVLVGFFLFMEARRYRYYEIWSS